MATGQNTQVADTLRKGNKNRGTGDSGRFKQDWVDEEIRNRCESGQKGTGDC